MIVSGLVGSTDWKGCRESRRCSRDTYPGSYITKHTSLRRSFRGNAVSDAVPQHTRRRGKQAQRPHRALIRGVSGWICYASHATNPRKALRGDIQKSMFKRSCQLLAINAHKTAPRTGQSGAGITYGPFVGWHKGCEMRPAEVEEARGARLTWELRRKGRGKPNKQNPNRQN